MAFGFKSLGSINDLLRQGASYVKNRAVQDLATLEDWSYGLGGAVHNGIDNLDNLTEEALARVQNVYNGRTFAPGEVSRHVADYLGDGFNRLGEAAVAVKRGVGQGLDRLDYSHAQLRDAEDYLSTHADAFDPRDLLTLQYAREMGVPELSVQYAARRLTGGGNRGFSAQDMGYLSEGDIAAFDLARQKSYATRQAQNEAVKQEARAMGAPFPNRGMDAVMTGGTSDYDVWAEYEAAMKGQQQAQGYSPVAAERVETNRISKVPAPSPMAMESQGMRQFAPGRGDAPIRYFDELDADDKQMASLERFLRNYNPDADDELERLDPQLLNKLKQEKMRRQQSGYGY